MGSREKTSADGRGGLEPKVVVNLDGMVLLNLGT